MKAEYLKQLKAALGKSLIKPIIKFDGTAGTLAIAAFGFNMTFTFDELENAFNGKE